MPRCGELSRPVGTAPRPAFVPALDFKAHLHGSRSARVAGRIARIGKRVNEPALSLLCLKTDLPRCTLQTIEQLSPPGASGPSGSWPKAVFRWHWRDLSRALLEPSTAPAPQECRRCLRSAAKMAAPDCHRATAPPRLLRNGRCTASIGAC